MNIKKLTLRNLEEATELVYNTSLQYRKKEKITKEDKKLFKKLFKEAFDEMETFGYFLNEKLVGIIALEDKNYITALYVLKEYQHMNIGTKLIKYVINYVKDYTDIIEVNSVKQAVKFYEKKGFKKKYKKDSSNVMIYQK